MPVLVLALVTAAAFLLVGRLGTLLSVAAAASGAGVAGLAVYTVEEYVPAPLTPHSSVDALFAALLAHQRGYL